MSTWGRRGYGGGGGWGLFGGGGGGASVRSDGGASSQTTWRKPVLGFAQICLVILNIIIAVPILDPSVPDLKIFSYIDGSGWYTIGSCQEIPGVQ